MRIHHTTRDQLFGVLLHGLHAVCGTGLDDRIHLRHFIFTDQVPNCRRRQHDFMTRNTATPDAF
ncbi:Uncharacterised protein [Vibrio cholerae]|nr:Uncharacterised protein [Vibrio cholerae]